MQYVAAGGLCAALGVILGAFGAHGLESKLTPQSLSVYQTAVQYHMYHALGVMVIGLAMGMHDESGALVWAARLMLAGIVLFSGSLYVLSLGGARWLGAITPLGGLAFICAWLLFAYALWRR